MKTKTKTLVVDNNPVLLKAISTILEQQGCEVLSVSTGLEALEALEKFNPDIVFTDLIMPHVSGEQLCRIIRSTKNHAHIFIVVLSAIILEDRERILREIDCDFCIAKGNLQEIRLHLHEALQLYKERKSKSIGGGSKTTRIPEGLKPSAMARELLSEKRHLSMILANLEEGILEVSDQGKVVTVNKAALRILSSSEEKLIGIPLSEVTDWGEAGALIKLWTQEQLVGRGMGILDILEDSPLLLQERIVIGTFLPVAEADTVFGLCKLRDISRQFEAEKQTKKLDDAIRLVKKMDAMSCMAGGVAHDFNNLLTVICGNLDIVALHGSNQGTTERTNLLEQARKAALVAVDLTRQISCFSNFGIVKRENVRIEQIVRDAVQEFFSEQEGGHKLRFTGVDCLVHVDPEEIIQSIKNVLQNAIEASEGEVIEITVSTDELLTPQLMSGQYVPAGSFARIDVRDFGKGILPEQLFKIFDPYYSTKERGRLKGMGLGLTIVYATLRNHGGYVIVSSVPDAETLVSLYIPVDKNDKKKKSSDDKHTTPKRSVVLVEPYKQMSDIGEIMLNHLGFSVTAVGDRSAAIQELKDWTRQPQSPRPLVILDLSEASGESAVETCRLVHEIDARIKVIAMSGAILDPIMENCTDYGFANILPKPYSIDSLKHITSTVLYN